MQIQGKVAIVTGASGGIGLATARKLAAAGAKLTLAARSKDKLEALSRELAAAGAEVLVVVTDMRDRAQVQRMVEETEKRFGRVDILVNNAGQGMAGLVEKADMDDFQRLFELNVLGPVLAIQAVVPLMEKSRGGMIVNVSSMVSKMHINGLSMYASTKSALNMISDTARAELADRSIKVSIVFPRMTATDFGKNSIGNSELRRQQRDTGARTIPVDPADLVAEKIVHAIESEVEEQYMDR
jgi:NADP-dependent 3-hydroxy acid dehydrogenase YdfG